MPQSSLIDLLLLFMNTNKQINKGTQMKVKKIDIGIYDIVINNNTYWIEQKTDCNPYKEWTIHLEKINGVENPDHDKWCDTVGTLKYAKECILRWENNA